MDISEIQTLENGLNTFINGIQDVSATAVLASILVVIYFLFKNRKDVKDVFNWYKHYKKQREEERSVTFKNQENILILQKSFNELQMKQKQMDEENHKHWETSKDIRNNFSSDINEIKSGISGIVSSLNDIEEKRALEEEQRKETKRSELKDRIGDLYRHYNQTQEWNYMEEESLRDLIKEYEANGGLNSFVHDRVEPESYTWRLITKEELDNEKMKF